MAKKKSAPRPASKIAAKRIKLPKSTSGKIMLVLLTLVGGYFLIWLPLLNYQDKQRFERASKELEKVSDLIISQVGKSISVIEEKYCGYSSVKFSKGTLRCHVKLTLHNSFQVENVPNSIWDSLVSNNFSEHPYAEFDENDKQIRQQLKSFSKLNCSADYTRSTNSGDIVLLCSGLSSAEHYPVKD